MYAVSNLYYCVTSCVIVRIVYHSDSAKCTRILYRELAAQLSTQGQCKYNNNVHLLSDNCVLNEVNSMVVRAARGCFCLLRYIL